MFFGLWTFDFRLFRLMMNVHRLNTDTPGPGHAREIHTRAAEEAGRQLLRFDIHRH